MAATVAGMELFARAGHKHVMRGWSWHRSHHESGTGWFERNDLYAVVFAGMAIALIVVRNSATAQTAAGLGAALLQWASAGMTLYGFLYFAAHDGLVHKRWQLRWVPRSGYLKRLYRAHRLHHAIKGCDGCVSFGVLWAPSPAALKRQLQAKRLFD